MSAVNDPSLAVRLRRRLADTASAATILGDVRAAPARLAAYRDGRRAVRLAFLAGAAAHGYLAHMPASRAELATRCGATRPDRLDAWVRVGLALGELREVDGDIVVVGHRALAIAAGDLVVTPFYRSIAEYYFGPHQELDALITGHQGRDDLSRSASTIADVSKVTEPVLSGAIAEIVGDVQPATWLEIGCGSGVHLMTALAGAPQLRAVAVDLDATVVAQAAAAAGEAGFGPRVDWRVGDALELVDRDERFDVVTLLNNIYYFAESQREALMERVVAMVAPGGVIVVASQCATEVGERGSIAAAQLDLLLRVQREAEASLPTMQGLVALVRNAPGVQSIDVRRPVPGEPYLVVRGTIG